MQNTCVSTVAVYVDIDSSTVTGEFGGKFKDPQVKTKFLNYIQMETKFLELCFFVAREFTSGTNLKWISLIYR
jgi:hypothetical protein